jgi:aldose 1-epimerase
MRHPAEDHDQETEASERSRSGAGVSRRRLLAGAAAGGVALALPPLAAAAAGRHEANPSGPQSLSGRDYTIRSGDRSVVITELGAGLRSLMVAGQEMLDTYPESSYPTGESYGQLLAPWPNRIAGATYEFEGTTEELPINEPSTGNAIHGLTRWMNWEPAVQERDRLVMALTLHAQPGYPFVVALQQEYALRGGSLMVRNTATNVGPSPAPYGVGNHPYFTVGSPKIDSDLLQLPVRTYFKTTKGNIPILPAVPVQGSPYDFRTMKAIGGTVMDTGFAGLTRDADGWARVIYTGPSGSPKITVALDRDHRYLQIYTGDTLSSKRRRGLAIEPYTCASNAFNNHLGLQVLKPGTGFSSTFTVTVS